MPTENPLPLHMPRASTRYYRHRLPVRISHWINLLCLIVLLMSGLGIFNAHPALYWGASSYTTEPAFLEISSETVPATKESQALGGEAKPEPSGEKRGTLRIGGVEFDTTGVLGVSTSASGTHNERAFPSWLTIPGAYSLADSRLWHFFFAWLFVLNGFFYIAYTLLSGHLRRDLLPDGRDLRGIGASIIDHLRFKHPEGEAARRYNVLQKLAYLIVIFILLPLIVLMGMAMSPMLNSLMTGWVDLFGGRQSARSIHFIVACLLLVFVLIHVFEVIVSGLWNHLRSMITGYYVIQPNREKERSP
ncbi:cytochrome b/b6 domain-containing protein [Massilia sp. CMS3.1]|uniref:cytochrome b/b6 domain-containing protein n=1 Tax=Massilia sp. CMS3.1 TaxID=3373083 RepID=UPI003EE4602D